MARQSITLARLQNNMPTKKIKRVVKQKSKLVKHEPNIKAVLSLLVLLVTFSIYLLFNTYKDTLMSDPTSLKIFIILALVLGSLLLALLFLVNPQKTK